MSKIYRIGIIGTKNVGKSTLSMQLMDALNQKGFRASIVHEVAQDCPLPINRATSIETGYWLFGTQIAREAISEFSNAIVICDRTVLDVMPFVRLSYNKESQSGEEIANDIGWLDHLIHDYLSARPYDQLFYLPKNENFWEPALSSEEIELRRLLDREFRTYLHEIGIPYVEITGDNTAARVTEIMDFILLLINEIFGS